jgi:hypothetical protein
MACRYNVDAIPAGDHVLMSLHDSSVDDERHLLYIADTPQLFAFSQDSGGLGQANPANTPSTGTWELGCGVWTSNVLRECYLESVTPGSDVTDVSPSGLDGFSIGGYNGATPAFYVSGAVEEACLWNVALTADDYGVMLAGYSPEFVKPQNIVAYFRLIRSRTSQIGGFTLTDVNGPTETNHFPVIYFTSTYKGSVAAAVGANAPTGALQGPLFGPFGGPI